MRMARHSHRTVTTLQGVTRLTLHVYRCRNTTYPRFHLDVIALVETRSLLGATEKDLVPLLEQAASICRKLDIPIAGVITDGQRSIRNAVARALPGIPHQLCQFHYLREAAEPISDADRHAKKELKKQVRGVRPLERALEGRTDEEADRLASGW
jgi:hypothetical protein